MSPTTIDKVRRFEARVAADPQVVLTTKHDIHAGMYARTLFIPSGVRITGALLKVATMLIVWGEVYIYTGEDEPLHVVGHEVIHAAAGRKQIIAAVSGTHLTMLFPTKATTVKDAEREFTDEGDILLSRLDPATNLIRITEEEIPCPPLQPRPTSWPARLWPAPR